MATVIPTGVNAVTGQANQIRNNEDVLSTGPNDASIFWLITGGGGQGLSISGNFPETSGEGGGIQMNAGDGGPAAGNGGQVFIVSGSSPNGDAGDLILTAGSSDVANAGGIALSAGYGSGSSSGGSVTILSGDNQGNGDGGDIILTAGEGGTNPGEGGFSCCGKSY